MKKPLMGAALALAILFVAALPQSARALDTLPSYSVTEIGTQLIAANPDTS